MSPVLLNLIFRSCYLDFIYFTQVKILFNLRS